MVNDLECRSLRWWRWVIVLGSFGLVVRLGFVIGVTRFDVPVGDQLFYSAQALTNADGRWFEQPFERGEPAADHPPLTALVLTPVSWLVRFEPLHSLVSAVTAQRLVMALLGTTGIVLMAMIGRKVGGEKVGLVAAAVTVVYANIWVNDGLLMAETPTFVVVAALVLVAVNTERHSRWWTAALLGGLSGLAALGRPELSLALPLVLLLITVVQWGRWRRLGSQVVGSICVWSALVVPWAAWNDLRFDAPVLLSTNDGLTLAGGHCDRTYFGDVGGWDIRCAYDVDVPPGEDASQASMRMRRVGLSYWRDHLDRYPVVLAARLARVASVGYLPATVAAARSEGRPPWVSYLGMVQYWLLVPLAVIGWRQVRVRRYRVILLSAVPVVVSAAVVANAYIRFRLPAEIGVVTLASMGIVHVGRRLATKVRVAPDEVSATEEVCAST